MESGLEDRNNHVLPSVSRRRPHGLNGVRPRRPEQFAGTTVVLAAQLVVSMESGLEDRNNKPSTALRYFTAVGSQWSPA